MGIEKGKKLFADLPKHLQTPLRIESIDFSEDMKALTEALKEVNAMASLKHPYDFQVDYARGKLLSAIQQVAEAIEILHRERVTGNKELGE